MPTRSADSPRPPARRQRPDGRRHPPHGRPSWTGRAPFFFHIPPPTMITSPDNDALRKVRKLAGRRWRDKTREFVAEGEDLIAAADEAGWRPTLVLREGIDVTPHLLKQV